MLDELRLHRRDFLRLAAMVTSGAVVAACQPAAPPAPEVEEKPAAEAKEEEEKPAKAAEKAELTWLVRSHNVENPWEENIVIPAFEEKHPEVTVNLVVTVGAEWNAKTMAMYAAGTPPDVHNGIVGTFIQLYAQEKVLELGPFVDADDFDLEAFGPLAKDPDMCRGGKQWALPILTTFGCPMFYNMDMFDEAGVERPPTDWKDKSWNWDRVVEIGEKLTKNYGTADAIYGFNGGDQYHQWAYAWGGDCWTKEWYEHGVAEKAFTASMEVIEGMTFKTATIHEYKIAPTPSDASALAQMGNPFKTGRLAMSWEGGWGYWNSPAARARRSMPRPPIRRRPVRMPWVPGWNSCSPWSGWSPEMSLRRWPWGIATTTRTTGLTTSSMPGSTRPSRTRSAMSC
jgi:multiple sugar transport system substrate-binding protein